jgi:hypothetical protein
MALDFNHNLAGAAKKLIAPALIQTRQPEQFTALLLQIFK